MIPNSCALFTHPRHWRQSQFDCFQRRHAFKTSCLDQAYKVPDEVVYHQAVHIRQEATHTCTSDPSDASTIAFIGFLLIFVTTIGWIAAARRSMHACCTLP